MDPKWEVENADPVEWESLLSEPELGGGPSLPRVDHRASAVSVIASLRRIDPIVTRATGDGKHGSSNHTLGGYWS